MVVWYKIFAWIGNLNPYISVLLGYFILVPIALALRGPLGWIKGRSVVTADWIDSVADPEGYRQSRQYRWYTPLTVRSFWLITLSLWGLGVLVALACWWIDQRY